MKSFLIVMGVILCAGYGFTKPSHSRCNQTDLNTFECNSSAPNPDPNGVQQSGNNNGVTVTALPDGNIDTNNFAAIDLGNGANLIDVNQARIVGLNRVLNLGTGPDSVTLNMADLESRESVIFFNSGNDNLIVRDSTITTTVGGVTIAVGNGNDTALISGSVVSTGPGVSRAFTGGSGSEDLTITNSLITNSSSDVTVSLGADDDMIFVENSTITNASDDFPLAGAAGNDQLTIGTGAVIPGGIDCDIVGEPLGFDTLIFAMNVPGDEFLAITEEISNLPVPAGSITINGILYEYRNCDVILSRITPVNAIPALSHLGFIAMAGVLGLVGFMVIRRKRVVT